MSSDTTQQAIADLVDSVKLLPTRLKAMESQIDAADEDYRSKAGKRSQIAAYKAVSKRLNEGKLYLDELSERLLEAVKIGHRADIAMPGCVRLAVKIGVAWRGDASISQLTFESLVDLQALLLAVESEADDQRSDPWVPVRLEHVIPDRSTMGRHAKDSGKTGVRRVDRGKYEIKRSRLGDYLAPRWRRDYGL